MPCNRLRLPRAVAVALALVAGPQLLALPIQTIVDSVSQSSYTDYLNNSLYTHTGDNRGPAGAQHNLARDNILATFTSFGLTAALAPFTYSGTTYNNVVATLPGYALPNDYFIVGAHYDSASNPGADDDASGVAGILEAARVLSQYDFPVSIVFIAFDAEELGLRGSRAYALAHRTDHILGMIELDMIAFNPTGANHDRARIFAGTAVQNQATRNLYNDMTTYVSGVTPYFAGGAANSDHYAFTERGFASALLIEPPGNPRYHQLTDSVDTAGYIDYWYATQMTRGAVAYLASEADFPEPATALSLLFGLLLLAAGRRQLRRR